MSEGRRSRGAIVKLFGVILIFLGALNSMLAWRGGYALSDLPVFLMAFGIFLYIIGAVGQGRERQDR